MIIDEWSVNCGEFTLRPGFGGAGLGARARFASVSVANASVSVASASVSVASASVSMLCASVSVANASVSAPYVLVAVLGVAVCAGFSRTLAR